MSSSIMWFIIFLNILAFVCLLLMGFDDVFEDKEEEKNGNV
ncbi:hypothetical protein [Bacillus cereus group sp. BfR-BA-01451]|nr:hypothetical protein [Bacillus cereus group sp. BfR-BA-01451]